MTTTQWRDRVRDCGSRMFTWVTRATAKAFSDSASAAPPYASVIFLVSTAVFLYQAMKRIPRVARRRPPPPLHPIIGPADILPNRPRSRVNFLGRLADLRLPLGAAQEAVLQEVLFSWLLAESYNVWLWMVSGVDALLDNYWIKMAELYPSSGGQSLAGEEQLAASLSTMLPLVWGFRDKLNSLTPPDVTTPEPDLSQLPCMLRPLLRPSFLRPLALCMAALLPLALLKLLPPSNRGGRDEEDEGGRMIFWVPFMPRVRWEETEFGSSGYFLDRELHMDTESSEERLQSPTPCQSEERLRSRLPGGPPEGPSWRRRSRSRSRRPLRSPARKDNELKATRST